MNSGIYQIRNTRNDKKYVGSSVDLKRRKRDHFKNLRTGIHSNIILQNSFKKHGEEAFVFEILEFVDRDNVRIVEQTYIDSGKFEYNISGLATGGFDFRNHPNKAEIYAKRAKHRKGKTNSERTRQILSEANFGESSHKFSGYFHTPWGVFPSANSAAKASGKISYVTILNICKNPYRKITNQAFGGSKYLRELFDNTVIGKTYKDIGFFFSPKIV